MLLQIKVNLHDFLMIIVISGSRKMRSGVKYILDCEKTGDQEV